MFSQEIYHDPSTEKGRFEILNGFAGTGVEPWSQ
jgi:hypothetical protein